MQSARGCCLCTHRTPHSSLLCSGSPVDCRAKESLRPLDHCSLEGRMWERQKWTNKRRQERDHDLCEQIMSKGGRKLLMRLDEFKPVKNGNKEWMRVRTTYCDSRVWERGQAVLLATWTVEMHPVQQRAYPPAFTVSIPVLHSRFPSPCQVTLPTNRGHIVVQSDGGGALAVQTAVGHMQGKDVGVSMAQDALPQHQVHAVTSCGGGGQVQDQSLILQRHGTPALTGGERRISLKAGYIWWFPQKYKGVNKLNEQQLAFIKGKYNSVSLLNLFWCLPYCVWFITEQTFGARSKVAGSAN